MYRNNIQMQLLLTRISPLLVLLSPTALFVVGKDTTTAGKQAKQ